MKCAKCLENYILSMWEFWPTIPSMLELVNKGVIEEERWRILCKIFFTLISPLTSKRDWHPMCCYSITPKSNIKVTRMKERVTK